MYTIKTYIANNERIELGEDMEYYPVYTYEDDRELFGISEDRREIFVDLVKATLNSLRLPVHVSQDLEFPRVRGEYIHAFLDEYAIDYNEKAETLFLSSKRCQEDEKFTLDADRLLGVFPNLKMVLCGGAVKIINSEDKLFVLDPFDLGEMSFLLMQEGDEEAANTYMDELFALDSKWFDFWSKVIIDYKREPWEHPEFDPNGAMVHDGMDDLFRVYLLGWYPKGVPLEEDFEKVFAEKHKDLKKAIELLPVRFRNCNLHEVSEKLFWDLQYVEAERDPDFDSFFRVLVETELIFPGAAEGIYKDGWIDYDNYDQLCEHLWSMGDEMTAEAVKEMIYSGADAEAVEAYLLKMSNVSCDAAYTLYELYKNGHVDTMIAVQDFTLDFPELKNEEKAAEHAKKCNIKHNI